MAADIRPAASHARSSATDPCNRSLIERRTSSSMTANLSRFVSRCLRPKAKSDRAIRGSPTSRSATRILDPLQNAPAPSTARKRSPRSGALLTQERDLRRLATQPCPDEPLDLDVHHGREPVVALVDERLHVDPPPQHRLDGDVDRMLGREQQCREPVVHGSQSTDSRTSCRRMSLALSVAAKGTSASASAAAS